jgi:predicted DNA-binding protein (MmcQ/YjbR family)
MARRRTTGARLLARCDQLIGAELTFPFGPQPAVFKVGGKVFALFGGPDPAQEPAVVSLKCDPEFAAALVREHPAIIPGYHLNKRHWITVDLLAELPAGLAEDLLIDSYDLVVDGLPKARRPLGRERRAAPSGDPNESPPAGGPTGPTARDVRRSVSELPEVTESSHHDVLDFRVAGKIFATVPTPGVVSLRLAPEHQAAMLADYPAAVTRAAGSWGRQGWTRVLPDQLPAGQLGQLLAHAWARRAPAALVRRLHAGSGQRLLP